MTAHSQPAAGAALWTRRLVAGARFTAMLYLFVVAGLLLATLTPALVGQQRPLAVVSGSMQPAIRPGAIVLMEPAVPDRIYDHPSIVAYPDRARPGRLVAHRVVGTAADETEAVSYTTRGDANRVADSGTVPHDAVVGSVRSVVPFVGLPALWLHRGNVVALATWGLGSLLAAAALLGERQA